MNSPKASDPKSDPTSDSVPGSGTGSASTRPSAWKDALAMLLASRTSLVRIEARDAASIAVRRLLLGVGFALCAFFVWALLLAGGIAAIANACHCPWYWLALGAALPHLLAAIILAKLARKPLPPTFPFTRAEFQKDREWLQKL